MKREEAIQNIKKLLGFSDTLDESIFTLFPELTENESKNEDERIRKFLLRLAKRCVEDSIDFSGDIKKKDVIDWLEKQKEQKPEAKLTGWVARDKDTEMLNFYMDCPPRRYDFWAAPASLHLPDKGFPDLKWEDEPIEVEVTITKK